MVTPALAGNQKFKPYVYLAHVHFFHSNKQSIRGRFANLLINSLIIQYSNLSLIQITIGHHLFVINNNLLFLGPNSRIGQSLVGS